MKNTRREHNPVLYRPRHGSDDDGVKNSYASLDNYARSPYLQRLNIQSNFKQKKPQRSSNEKISKNTLKALQNRAYKLPNHNSKQQQVNRSTSSVQDYQSDYTSKKMTKLKLPKIEVEQNNLTPLTKNQTTKKNPLNSFSATLEVSTKKKKLKPIKPGAQFQIVTRTKAGTNGKQTKINQDIVIIDTKLPYGLKLYCVCDGHGLNGHLVSAFIKTDLIKKTLIHIQKSLYTNLKICKM